MVTIAYNDAPEQRRQVQFHRGRVWTWQSFVEGNLPADARERIVAAVGDRGTLISKGLAEGADWYDGPHARTLAIGGQPDGDSRVPKFSVFFACTDGDTTPLTLSSLEALGAVGPWFPNALRVALAESSLTSLELQTFLPSWRVGLRVDDAWVHATAASLVREGFRITDDEYAFGSSGGFPVVGTRLRGPELRGREPSALDVTVGRWPNGEGYLAVDTF